MAKCPHCEYEAAASTFEFESVRVDAHGHPDSDRGVVCCPSCGAALGGYSYERGES